MSKFEKKTLRLLEKLNLCSKCLNIKKTFNYHAMF